MFTFKKIRAAVAFGLAAGVVMGAMAAVPMQTVKDSAVAGRLVINGKKVFISGMNIAWVNFANDVGDTPLNITDFRNYVRDIKQAGGNAVRWWLHTDAQHCPKINSNGEVTGLGSRTIANVRQALDTAYNYGVVVSLCLFSFDLLQNDNNKTSAQMTANEKFLTVPANLDTYITKALRPMLDSLGNHPAIMCWEVFNEPEGMSKEHGWSTVKIDHSHIMRFTNKIAGEVHRRTKKMASTGIHNWSSGERARYTTAKLKEAGGDNDGFLDFYMAHYYPQYGGTSESPFHHPASYWGFDKPVLIGEFPAQSWGPGTGYTNIQSGTAMTINAAFEYAYDNGYCGAMSWSITEGDKNKFGSIETTKPALKDLYDKHKADIDLKDVTIVTPTGDLAMKVAVSGLPVASPYADLHKDGDLDLSGKTNLTFEMFISPGSGTNLKIIPAIQVGNWDWKDAPNQSISLAGKETNKWLPVTIPFSAFNAGSLSEVKAIVLEFQPSDSPYSGTIYIDNVKADNTVISDFTTLSSGWSATKYDGGHVPVEQITVDIVQRPTNGGASPVITASAKPTANRTPLATVSGKTLKVSGLGGAEASVKLVNLKGKAVATFRAAGSGTFSLSDIPAGNYLVELTSNGKKLGSSRVAVR